MLAINELKQPTFSLAQITGLPPQASYIAGIVWAETPKFFSNQILPHGKAERICVHACVDRLCYWLDRKKLKNG